MLQIVQFTNGKYGLQNQFTGIVIEKEFRTIRGAQRYIRRANRRLRKALARVNKR